MSLELEPRTLNWNLGWQNVFLYTHASETQEFNYKMNVVLINLKTNMGMNVSIHLHYG